MQLDEYYDLPAGQLNEFRQKKKEEKYVLVDVRLPEEYEDEHIPGCILIPLSEISVRLTELPKDCDIIFYCNSGRRSKAAALFATSVPFFQKKIYNLLGGILKYFDKTVPDYPKIGAVDLQGPAENILQAAINLERGTSIFYSRLAELVQDSSLSSVLGKLARAEEAHARHLHGLLKKELTSTPPFEELYSSLAGDVVEGGKTLESLLPKEGEVADGFSVNFLETVLDIEYAAYDLYASLAQRFRGTARGESFFSLAQAEKTHMRSIAEAFD